MRASIRERAPVVQRDFDERQHFAAFCFWRRLESGRVLGFIWLSTPAVTRQSALSEREVLKSTSRYHFSFYVNSGLIRGWHRKHKGKMVVGIHNIIMGICQMLIHG